MNFHIKQILSSFLMASLVWVFIGCLAFCGDSELCESELLVEIVSENHTGFDTDNREDSCPLGNAFETTAAERITVNVPGSALAANNFGIFLPKPVFSKANKNSLEHYSPPENLPPQRSLRILRI